MLDEIKQIKRGIELTIEGWYYISVGTYKIFYIVLIYKVLGNNGLYTDTIVASTPYLLIEILKQYMSLWIRI